MKKKLTLYVLSLFMIDRAIKVLIAFIIPFEKEIVVIKDFYNITYVKNTGAAWSIFSDYRFFLVVIGILCLIAFYYLFLKEKKLNTYKVISYAFLIAGILGNLVDRILYGYVIDYLQFNVFGYNFPVFNLADSLIVVSVFLISYELLKEGE